MKKRYNFKYTFLFLFFLCACYHKINSFPTLVNQGILPVSKEQAYVGANLFLAQEMKKSEFLYNFIRDKGAPDAIKIDQNTFDNTKLYLYYYNDKEFYTGDLSSNNEWIIKGPEIPSWRLLKSIKNVMDIGSNDAPFMIDGVQRYFPQKKISKIDEKPIDVTLNLPKAPPTYNVPRRVFKPGRPTPRKTYNYKKPSKPVKKVEVKKPEVKKESSVAKVEPAEATLTIPEEKPQLEYDFLANLEDLKNFTPLNSDKMAIAISKGYARRNDNGDVIHIVNNPTETLDKISAWYTGSELNAVQLEKLNNLEDASHLQKGTTITIPFSMVVNVKQMK